MARGCRTWIALVAYASAASRAAAQSSTYTPTGGVLNASAFAAWLTARAAAGDSTLVLAAGTYNLSAPSAGARAHLVLPPIHGVHVDASGVTLTLSARRAGAVYVTGWVAVALTGLHLRYAEPPSNSAAVDAVDAVAGTADVSVEPGMPIEDFVAGTVASCNVFDAHTRLMKPATWDVYVTAVAPLGGRAFRLTAANVGQLLHTAPGDLLGCRLPGGDHTFVVDGCEISTFSGITLYDGPLFGFLHTGGPAVGARGGNVFDRVAVRLPAPPPGASAPPLLSTTADGFHAVNVPRGPTITNSHFEGMNDDGIAIHGTFSLVTDADVAGGRLWVAAQACGTAQFAVGEAVALHDGSFAPQPPLGPGPGPRARTLYTVLAVARAPPDYAPPRNTSHTVPRQSLAPGAVTFVVLSVAGPGGAPLPAGTGFDWLATNAGRVGAGFAIRNTTVANHRARGMLIKAGGGVIEGCTVANSSMGGIVVTPELYWEEADFVSSLVIANNSVVDVGRGRQGYGGILLAAVDPDGGLASARGHADVLIANNTLTDVGYAPIALSSVAGVTLVGNRVVAPFHAAPAADALPTCCEPLPNFVAVFAVHVDDLAASGNCVVPAPPGQSSLMTVFNTTDVSGAFDGGVVECTH